MALKERDYSNLKETERLYDAIKITNTQVKDYSLTHIVTVVWRNNDEANKRRLVEIKIGKESWVGHSRNLLDAVNGMADRANEDGWFQREAVAVPGYDSSSDLLLDTMLVNDEALRDRVARVHTGNNSALIDLEELLKATRYA